LKVKNIDKNLKNFRLSDRNNTRRSGVELISLGELELTLRRIRVRLIKLEEIDPKNYQRLWGVFTETIEKVREELWIDLWVAGMNDDPPPGIPMDASKSDLDIVFFQKRQRWWSFFVRC